MSRKVSLVILKTDGGFMKLYHKQLRDPIKEGVSSNLWSHPVIMASHTFRVNGQTFNLRDSLDNCLGVWCKDTRMPSSEYPFTRLEVYSNKHDDPLHKDISEVDFAQSLIFRYDNPGRHFVQVGAEIPKAYGDYDEKTLHKMISEGFIPEQRWAMFYTRQIEKSVFLDMIKMKKGEWVNPKVTLEDLPPYVITKDIQATINKKSGKEPEPLTETIPPELFNTKCAKPEFMNGWIDTANGRIRTVVRTASGTDEAVRRLSKATRSTANFILEEFMSADKKEYIAYMVNFKNSDHQYFTVKTPGIDAGLIKEFNVGHSSGLDLRRCNRSINTAYIVDSKNISRFAHLKGA